MESNYRFADYFFRAGIVPNANLSKKRLVETKHELSSVDISKSTESLDQSGHVKKDPHPLSFRYEPDTIYRYPPTDYNENDKYPTYTPMFCFPHDVVLVNHESGRPADAFHTFVITEANGSKIYGVCLITHVPPSKEHARQIENMIADWRSDNLADSDYEFAQHVQAQLAFEKERLLKMKMGAEPVDKETMHVAEEAIQCLEELIIPLRQSVLVDAENVYVPTCIGVIGRWPWYDVLKDWLCILLQNIENSDFNRFPFERCVINLLQETPLPPPGKLEICIPFGTYKLYCSRPPLNSAQIFKNYSSYPVFRSMSIENIVTMFELLLTEYKVVLLSEYASMLTLTCEVLCSWLYPFYWHHILIPVLPRRLLNYLQAPVPFLVGIQKASFPQWTQENWRPGDAAIVDIDNDHIDFPPLKVKIPIKERKKLLMHLEKYSGQSAHSIKKGVPENMKCAYPGGKLQISSFESVINKRKIQDIPQSMYSRYSNSFLAEKASGLKNISPRKASRTFSQSLDTLSISTGGPSSTLLQKPPSMKGKSANQPTLESYTSFVASPSDVDMRPSVSDMSRSDNGGSDNVEIRLSFANQNVSSGEPSISPSIESSTEPVIMASARTPVAKSPAPQMSWWQKVTASATKSVPPVEPASASAVPNIVVNPDSSEKEARPTVVTRSKTPSIFDRFMNAPDANPLANFQLDGSSPETPDTPTEVYDPTQSPNLMLSKEAHVFHELVLTNPDSKEADIGYDDFSEEEELADRFTPDSHSSDDISKADSQTPDSRGAFFKRTRVPGQSRNTKELQISAKRKPNEPLITKGPRVKITEKDVCKLCHECYDPRKETILMCQNCHIQIHSSCLILTEGYPCPVHFNQEKISQGFFRIFTSVLKHYRNYLKVPVAGQPRVQNEEETWFRKAEFVSEFDGETRIFMSVILDTQAFAQFTLDRIERPEDDYEILYFDESIKQKLNRSRMRFTKDPTPFLNETTYQISKSIPTISFNTQDLPPDRLVVDPLNWLDAYTIAPRPIQQLLTEGDKQMMKSHTHELVQRSRLAAMRGKQDFTKWMKLKWRTDENRFDEQRRELFEERLNQVSAVIDEYEAAHISSQTPAQIELAISKLIEQSIKLQTASDEDQLLEGNDTGEFKKMLERLMRVISIYQEHQAQFHNTAALGIPVDQNPPPLPPRTGPVVYLTHSKNSSDAKKVSDWVSSVQDESGVATPQGRSRTPSNSSLSNDKRRTISQRNVSFVAIPDELGFHRMSVTSQMLQNYPSSSDVLSSASPHPPKFTGDNVSIGSTSQNRDALIDMEALHGSNADSNSVSNVQVSANVSTNGDMQDLELKNELVENSMPMKVVMEVKEDSLAHSIDKAVDQTSIVEDEKERHIANHEITPSKQEEQILSVPNPEAQRQNVDQMPAL